MTTSPAFNAARGRPPTPANARPFAIKWYAITLSTPRTSA
jgi:hypothetical protein